MLTRQASHGARFSHQEDLTAFCATYRPRNSAQEQLSWNVNSNKEVHRI